MGQPQAVFVAMTDMSCGRCGIRFAVPEDWRIERQQTGHGWYCPNGHPRVYGDSDVKKAERALADERQRHAETLARANTLQLRTDKAEQALASQTRRTAAGVCPCCSRTFKQLAAHMKSKHPAHVAKTKG